MAPLLAQIALALIALAFLWALATAWASATGATGRTAAESGALIVAVPLALVGAFVGFVWLLSWLIEVAVS